jgi:hypothetical protein
MAFRRKATISITPNHSIVIDHEDVGRVESRIWRTWAEAPFTDEMPAFAALAEHGLPTRLLGGVIMDTDKWVTQRVTGNDWRKANLVVSQ